MSHVDFKKSQVPRHLFPMSHITSKTLQCHMLILRNAYNYVVSLILMLISLYIGFMSHVDFKKWPCRWVEFRGREPVSVS